MAWWHRSPPVQGAASTLDEPSSDGSADPAGARAADRPASVRFDADGGPEGNDDPLQLAGGEREPAAGALASGDSRADRLAVLADNGVRRGDDQSHRGPRRLRRDVAELWRGGDDDHEAPWVWEEPAQPFNGSSDRPTLNPAAEEVAGSAAGLADQAPSRAPGDTPIPAGAHPGRVDSSSRKRRASALVRGRHVMPAGHAIVVVVVALALAALLNAQALRKSAYAQGSGWTRSIALAATRPLVDLSHLIGADQPRAALKELIGRGGDDRIDTRVAFSPQPSPPPAPPARPSFGPTHRLRLWVAGDSIGIEPGQALAELASGVAAIAPDVPVEGRLATGLTRPDLYNWFERIRSELASARPDAVVLSFGANDDHPFMTGGPGDGVLGDFASPTWQAEYRRRVAGVMDEVARDGRVLIWLGPPIVRDPAQSARFRVLDDLIAAEAARRAGRVAFVDLYRLFQTADGSYADFLPGRDGQLEAVRAPDGIHLSPTGARWVAEQILARLRELVRLGPSAPAPAPALPAGVAGEPATGPASAPGEPAAPSAGSEPAPSANGR